jgi:hypothetical protein
MALPEIKKKTFDVHSKHPIGVHSKHPKIIAKLYLDNKYLLYVLLGIHVHELTVLN